MKIVIIGLGTIGKTILKNLSGEGHTITIIDEDKAKIILSEDEIQIYICLNMGRDVATAWGCDLTYDYVKINGDYRT